MRDCSADRFKTAAELGTVVWYISFGDLLTLLVCFFLVLTPWQKLSKVNNSQHNPHLIKEETSPVADGTAFASSKAVETQTIRAEVAIFECQPSDGRCAELESGRIVDEVRGLRTVAARVSIRLCGRGSGRLATLERVGAEVKRSEVGALPLSIELGDVRECEEMMLRPVTERSVGSVRVQ